MRPESFWESVEAKQDAERSRIQKFEPGFIWALLCTNGAHVQRRW